VVDTLILSQLFNPIRDKGHSLSAWGNELGFPKMECEDFTTYTEDMFEYCKNDVELTEKVYQHLQGEGKGFSSYSITLEHNIRAVLDQQEKNGFALNMEKTTGLLGRLSDEAQALTEWSLREFPDTKIKLKTKIKEIPFNISSRQQIAECLKKKGWKPKQFTPKSNQPMINEEILNKIDMEEAKKFSRFFLLQKRIAQIQGWINAYDDTTGRVHGRVLTLKTITGRMAHMSPNMANVPAVRSPFGEECRDCWTVGNPQTHSLVGTDASGLELRCLAHFMEDEEFTHELLHGDIHTRNMKMAGITDRDKCKTFIYAWLYGAQASKIGKIVGVGKVQAQILINRFLENMPALEKLRDDTLEKAKEGVIQGVDGRRLHIRSPHSALNTLIQGAGAVVCKNWVVRITHRVRRAGLDVKLVASIHDEYQFEVAKKDVQEFGKITKKAMRDTEKELNFKCPLDSTWKEGDTWAKTH
jgi:DNA polymerase I-like protein with 3'-5' exonuclease and polymerase domains